jgi:penicillin-binding protein 1A
MSIKKLIAIALGLAFLGLAAVATVVIILTSDLPQIITVKDYKPLLVSEVYDREGAKIGEFSREKRLLVPYEEIPEQLVHAFISAEDSAFFEHDGLNFVAIFRAVIANLKAGRKVQGGSTITQQVARSLLLTSKKTYERKIKEAVLAMRMEDNLSKQEIMYLYLNQIYLGQGAYGVGAAAEIYFRKPVSELTVPECALLAGLPQAPSRYSPIYRSELAKKRQKYVLRRMAEEDYIKEDEAKKFMEQPLKVYVRKDFTEEAPYFVETIRLILEKELGKDQVWDNGIQVHTSLDLTKQKEARHQVRQALRDLDKRQGFRGPLESITEAETVAEFLLQTREELLDDLSPIRIIQADGTIESRGELNLSGKDEEGNPLPPVPDYVPIDKIVKGIVTSVDDKWGLTTVRFAEGKGVIDIATMEWARTPDPKKSFKWDKISKPSEALKKGDVIWVRPVAKKFFSTRLNDELNDLKRKKGDKYERPAELPEADEYAELFLEQEPVAEGALIALDQKTSDVVAMVGGYDYEKSQYNKTIQAVRQTGSSFKPFVYAAALDKGYTPATMVHDAPLVYEETKEVEDGEELEEPITTKWKPTNHGKKFRGEVPFRTALINSMNNPTLRIIEDIGVNWVEEYARRLEIFSPLNRDYTLALGSSGVTLYEITKAYAILGNLGKHVTPIIIHNVKDRMGAELMGELSLDHWFKEELEALRKANENKRRKAMGLPQLDDNGEPIPQLEASTEEQQAAEEIEEATSPESQSIAAGEDNEEGEEETQKQRPKNPPLYFKNKNQLMKPQTAYLITSLMQGAVEEGTGRAAKSLGRPTAGKTGTTNAYYDAWFVGYTPDYVAGVWMGFEKEQSLGAGEVGGRAALPAWLGFMKYVHEGLPVRNFRIPEGIVFANIDNETGKLASAQSSTVVRQAFAEGSEPEELTSERSRLEDDKDFFKQDLSE